MLVGPFFKAGFDIFDGWMGVKEDFLSGTDSLLEELEEPEELVLELEVEQGLKILGVGRLRSLSIVSSDGLRIGCSGLSATLSFSDGSSGTSLMG